MKAAVLEQFGRPLAVRDVPEPEIGTGEVLVDVLAACVLPYSAEVFSGARRYPLEPPVIPGVGGVGRVVRTGPDATHLQVGDLVWCDPTVRSRDDARQPDITLQGWSSRGEGGLRLSRHFHDGSFAQRMAVPTENALPLGRLSDEQVRHFAAASVLLVPYGGLVAGGLRAGETVVVSGATGNFGSAAVAVALGLGAARVVATGRNAATLAGLHDRFGKRVTTVTLSGDAEHDQNAIRDTAVAPVDLVIDLLPPDAPTAAVRTVVMAVREYGRIVLMGGVGMLGGEDLALPYPWLMRNSITVRGQWMLRPEWQPRFFELVRAGLIDVMSEDVATFGLDDVNDAVAFAAAHGGPFTRTVLTP